MTHTDKLTLPLTASTSEDLLETTVPEELLASDPAQLFSRLRPETRQLYLDRVTELAKAWNLSESQICEAALALSSEHPIAENPERRLLSHVGYYLLDDTGVLALAGHLGMPARGVLRAVKRRVRRLMSVYFAGSVILWAALCLIFIHKGDSIFISALVGPSLLLIAASTVRMWIAIWLSHSRLYPLAQLDLRDGVTSEYKTLVAVPAVLLSKEHVGILVNTLEAHCAVVSDQNVLFVLLTDLPDSDRECTSDECRSIAEYCVQSIVDLNKKPAYADSKPFFLLHRNHRFCSTQRRWMGWERKRGKLHQLFNLIASGEDPFAEKVGDMQTLRQVKYVVVLDEDSKLEKHTIQDLVGTHVHPLNHPYIAENGVSLKRGYGILQPLIATPAAGQTHDEEPLSLHRVFHQDAFDQCVYTGKGIINVSAYQSVLGDALPEECVLSHDTVESALLRAGSILSAKILEPRPKGHEVICLRRHRWIRGDWQNVRFLKSSLNGRRILAFGRISIADLLLNSLLPIATVIVMCRGLAAVHMGIILVVLIATSGVFFRPVWLAITSLGERRPRKAARFLLRVLMLPLWVLLSIGDLAHSAAISADAIGRTLYRMSTGRNLLEWRTSLSTEMSTTKLSICKTYRFIEAIVFSTASVLVGILSHNIPLAILLMFWGLQSGLLLSSKRKASPVPNE